VTVIIGSLCFLVFARGFAAFGYSPTLANLAAFKKGDNVKLCQL
jgi:hypothetical protein